MSGYEAGINTKSHHGPLNRRRYRLLSRWSIEIVKCMLLQATDNRSLVSFQLAAELDGLVRDSQMTIQL
jgi:hypothetical protein